MYYLHFLIHRQTQVFSSPCHVLNMICLHQLVIFRENASLIYNNEWVWWMRLWQNIYNIFLCHILLHTTVAQALRVHTFVSSYTYMILENCKIRMEWGFKLRTRGSWQHWSCDQRILTTNIDPVKDAKTNDDWHLTCDSHTRDICHMLKLRRD